MSLSRPFILRPVATSLFMAAILLAGAVAYQQLPVSALPEVDYPTIQVTTFYPGAGPDVMASSVTAPLERQFGQMPGLKQMTSTSSFGSSVITLQFDLALNIDVAEQEVQAAVNASGTFLPRDLPNPPVYSKVNPADAPVLTLALTSETLPLSQVQSLADTRLAPKISQLPGVGLVSISGGQKPAVRVQANPTALAAYGIGLSQLQQAIANANANQAKGTFDGPRQAYTIGANDQLTSGDAYKPLIVAYQDGGPVRISDVADVVDGVEDAHQAAWMNQTPAVIVNVQRQPGANTIAVVDRIKSLLPQLTATLPPAVKVRTLTDRTTTIRASIDDVQFELLLTDRAGRDGHLPLPAHADDHADSRRRGAALARRHVRRDVHARVQPEQPDADGAHHLDRLRRRRRDRDDREHRALRRGRREAAAGGAQGRGADRLHDRVADRLAHRGADSAALHGRHRRPAVPGVRDHAQRHDPGVGRRVADADADDVRADPAAHAEGAGRPAGAGAGVRRSTASSRSTAGR